MDEGLVKDLSFEAHRKMDVLLLPSNPGRDWKTLADKMGYPMETILYCECKKDKDKGPVMELIKDYEDRGKTISELISFLSEMERFDLIQDLQPFIGMLKLTYVFSKYRCNFWLVSRVSAFSCIIYS